LCPIGLDHRNAFAIYGRHQNRPCIRPGFQSALGIEGIQVLGRILDDLFDAARGNRRAADLRDPFLGFAEVRNGSANRSSLHRRLDHALLPFVGKRARRQLQGLVQRMDAGGASP